MAKACLEVGLHISFAGMLTFKNNGALRQVAATIPHDRLLLETDSPYLAPVPHRGKRNEPAFVGETAACLAQALGIPIGTLEAQTSRNARAFCSSDNLIGLDADSFQRYPPLVPYYLSLLRTRKSHMRFARGICLTLLVLCLTGCFHDRPCARRPCSIDWHWRADGTGSGLHRICPDRKAARQFRHEPRSLANHRRTHFHG